MNERLDDYIPRDTGPITIPYEESPFTSPPIIGRADTNIYPTPSPYAGSLAPLVGTDPVQPQLFPSPEEWGNIGNSPRMQSLSYVAIPPTPPMPPGWDQTPLPPQGINPAGEMLPERMYWEDPRGWGPRPIEELLRMPTAMPQPIVPQLPQDIFSPWKGFYDIYGDIDMRTTPTIPHPSNAFWRII